MLWEIEIRPRGADTERSRVAEEYDLLTHSRDGEKLVAAASRGYLLEGELAREQAERLARELLVDAVAESGRVTQLGEAPADDLLATVLLKPGVMDPAALSVVEAARDLGVTLVGVRSFRRYFGPRQELSEKMRRVLVNDAIEQVVAGPLRLEHLTLGRPYEYALRTVTIQNLDDDALTSLSRSMKLALSLAEMKTVQAHFREQAREPTDVELETIAQTWSEHCSHKTLRGTVEFDGRRYENLLKETIFAATVKVREALGADDWCVSVFEDNAGVVRFDEKHHVCFKVETHNRPSAIEPYGGANTGIGGVIRDPLGTGLGAKPVCNTDVFCFAPPDTAPESLPQGVLHPLKVMKGVVSGVRDYGNRMGIPTVNGAVCFDERYLANPLVFCGTVGVIPVDRAKKEARAGDLIVAVGGRTGRDGIHGATFSSEGLHSASEKESGGAVQIGNAIAQKKLLDVVLQARDLGLYSAITDCGAGGFSSAVGEMSAEIGAAVHLERAPLKYEGLSYVEIWISESQERMILAVPPQNWERLRTLCASEDVEATALGTFEATGRLRLYYHADQVGDLDLHFLHEGRPKVVRQAKPPLTPPAPSPTGGRGGAGTEGEVLLRLLGSLNTCSKEWIIRQYDHEVQGGSVVKPLVGARDDGPSDAAVVMPTLGSWAALAVGCGINPRYGDLDPYAMAAAAIDEAVRNVVAVGADPARVAILDNFCWGDTDRPEVLGSLVLAAQACHDVAVAYRMPFISGKDSLKNEFKAGDRRIVIPPTLLISALGQVPDARGCVTMDLKEAGNALYLLGQTRDEMGGSHYHLLHGIEGGSVPRPDLALAPRLFAHLHEAIKQSLVRSCHDLSEGGLAVAVAEMAFAGGVGADLTATGAAGLPDHVALFSESTTRFVVEVKPDRAAAFEALMAGLPLTKLGGTVKEPRLRVAGSNGEWVIWAGLDQLKEAWQKPLRF
jgi:phosphoribosylformylglycinamidine synthase II